MCAAWVKLALVVVEAVATILHIPVLDEPRDVHADLGVVPDLPDTDSLGADGGDDGLVAGSVLPVHRHVLERTKLTLLVKQLSVLNLSIFPWMEREELPPGEGDRAGEAVDFIKSKALLLMIILRSLKTSSSFNRSVRVALLGLLFFSPLPKPPMGAPNPMGHLLFKKKFLFNLISCKILISTSFFSFPALCFPRLISHALSFQLYFLIILAKYFLIFLTFPIRNCFGQQYLSLYFSALPFSISAFLSLSSIS